MKNIKNAAAESSASSERDCYTEYITRMLMRCDLRKIRIVYEFVSHLCG